MSPLADRLMRAMAAWSPLLPDLRLDTEAWAHIGDDNAPLRLDLRHEDGAWRIAPAGSDEAARA